MMTRKYEVLQKDHAGLQLEFDELRKHYLQEKHKAKSGNPFGEQNVNVVYQLHSWASSARV
jgi:hypothetical protein